MNRNLVSNIALVLSLGISVGVFVYYLPLIISEVGWLYPVLVFGVATAYIVVVAISHYRKP